MGLKQFNQDLREAASTPPGRVTNIRKGDSEGDIAFTYTHDAVGSIELGAIAPDVDSYPRDCSFLIFTSDDNVDKSLVSFLERLSSKAQGKQVAEVIGLISTSLSAKLEPTSTNASDVSSSAGEDEGNDEHLDIDYDESDDPSSDEEYEIDLDATLMRAPPSPLPARDPDSLKQLKRHLKQASALGLFICLPSANMEEVVSGTFSMAVRVSKLGIHDEALEAWGLKSSEFVVMLVKCLVQYVSTDEILELPSDQTAIQFRIGKCTSPRPSPSSVRSAFQRDEDKEDETQASSQTESLDGNAFGPLYVSRSLDFLLNHEFPSLLRLRRSQGLSWDQAQKHKLNIAKGRHVKTRDSELEATDEAAWMTDDTEETQGIEETDEIHTNLDWLQHDYALDDEKDLNVLVVAMQFAIQRLVRCTKYCMVCHQRTYNTFEAVKPYVCDSSLCLFQYLALGFGPSIEHEIINHPFVVDLLVSFFFSSNLANRTRKFPTGLGLKSCLMGSAQDPSPYLKVEFCLSGGIIHFNADDFDSYHPIKKGDAVTVMVKQDTPVRPVRVSSPGNASNAAAPPADTSRPTALFPPGTLGSRINDLGNPYDLNMVYICIIESVDQQTYTFHLADTRVSYDAAYMSNGRPKTEPPPDGWQKAVLFKHDREIDGLNELERRSALHNLSCAIPSVLEMKAYLEAKPGRQLSSWKRMDASAYTLLNWIVATNRSFIVQDGPVPTDVGISERLSQDGNKVVGMGEEWMQFRFAQGSPGKEQRFMDEMEQFNHAGGGKKKHPSLFLWHGSPISNWHSIIRSGLDFANSLHGRAYGDGVYFSNDMRVSLTYTGPLAVNPSASDPTNRLWSNSVLQPSHAISICEVINEPDEFVCKYPHYVINKVEWIQCRYLFVLVQPKPSANSQEFAAPLTRPRYIYQDPTCPLVGAVGNAIQIPLTAIPVRRRSAMAEASAPGQTLAPMMGGESVNPWEAVDDDVRYFSDSEGSEEDSIMVRKRPLSADSAQESVRRPSKLTTEMQVAKCSGISPNTVDFEEANSTGFRPGALDHSSIPKLMEPTWALSSPGALRCLNRQIKDLQKLQVTSELSALGWYVDFNQLSNMFSWIVEMHSFDDSLPLASDMKRAGVTSIVLECRFGASFPMSPPFVRVVRPRFLPFARGGGGHVTIGGSICSELLTNSAWSPVLSLEKVFLDVRMNLCDLDPPARLDPSQFMQVSNYSPGEGTDAYIRAVANHGWRLPDDMSAVTWSQ